MKTVLPMPALERAIGISLLLNCLIAFRLRIATNYSHASLTYHLYNSSCHISP